jgi:hypothetical protein
VVVLKQQTHLGALQERSEESVLPEQARSRTQMARPGEHRCMKSTPAQDKMSTEGKATMLMKARHRMRQMPIEVRFRSCQVLLEEAHCKLQGADKSKVWRR